MMSYLHVQSMMSCFCRPQECLLSAGEQMDCDGLRVVRWRAPMRQVAALLDSVIDEIFLRCAASSSAWAH